MSLQWQGSWSASRLCGVSVERVAIWAKAWPLRGTTDAVFLVSAPNRTLSGGIGGGCAAILPNVGLSDMTFSGDGQGDLGSGVVLTNASPEITPLGKSVFRRVLIRCRCH